MSMKHPCKFWIVVKVGHDDNAQAASRPEMHFGKAEAMLEAKRLCCQNPASRFYVMESVHVAECNAVEVKEVV